MVLDSLRPTTSGGRHPAFFVTRPTLTARLPYLLIDTAKLQQFSYTSKFSPSIWGDFQHELMRFLIEDAHARHSSCKHGFALA